MIFMSIWLLIKGPISSSTTVTGVRWDLLRGGFLSFWPILNHCCVSFVSPQEPLAVASIARYKRHFCFTAECIYVIVPCFTSRCLRTWWSLTPVLCIVWTGEYEQIFFEVPHKCTSCMLSFCQFWHLSSQNVICHLLRILNILFQQWFLSYFVHTGGPTEPQTAPST